MVGSTSIGAYAVRRDEPDSPLLADSIETLNKVIALQWIAQWQPPEGVNVEDLKEALLAERWGDAVERWMSISDEIVDVFPSPLEVHQSGQYPDDEFGLRIQTSPLFGTKADTPTRLDTPNPANRP